MDEKSLPITNVMRTLERLRIPYQPHYYGDGVTAYSGVDVAHMVGRDPACVFKTLVTVAKSGKNYVFVIPSAMELDLKKAAAAVGEKSVEMLPQKELLPLTGYVHGGCSPVGMKKQFRTVIDATCLQQSTILVSAGKIGTQIETEPAALKKAIPFTTADLTRTPV